MTHDLPAWLRTAIDALVEGESGREIALSSARLSANYREGGTSSAISSTDDANAYAATRMPATFAAIGAALDATLRRLPDFSPVSLLDIGCGPGTASFAASEALPGLQQITLVDRNRALLATSERLGSAAPLPSSRTANRIPADIETCAFAPADLVIVAYAMVELTVASIRSLASRLWQACDGVLLIVEPGTPIGYGNVLQVRDALIPAGAHVAAPCPHEKPCPLSAPDWCHFSQRLARSRLHRIAKAASVPFEDERFSYVAFSRQPASRPVRRVLAPPGGDESRRDAETVYGGSGRHRQDCEPGSRRVQARSKASLGRRDMIADATASSGAPKTRTRGCVRAGVRRIRPRHPRHRSPPSP